MNHSHLLWFGSPFLELSFSLTHKTMTILPIGNLHPATLAVKPHGSFFEALLTFRLT